MVILFTSFFADLGILAETPFLSRSDLAAFGICLKVSLIVGFVVQVAHQIVLPDLAEAYATRNVSHLPKVLLHASGFPITFCAAATLASWVAGDRFLGLFGPDFSHAGSTMTILISCQLLRALAGPSTHMLTLVGAQKTNAALCGVSCLFLLAASAALTPAFGLIGAAVAVFATFGFWLTATSLALRWHRATATDAWSLLLRT